MKEQTLVEVPEDPELEEEWRASCASCNSRVEETT